MGRILKRVPLNFSAPIGEIWKGYINPYYKKCSHCDGNGSTPARQRLVDLVQLLLLSGEDAAKNKMHPYFISMKQSIVGFNENPSIDMVKLTEGLAGRKMDRLMGHDALDRMSATAKIIQAAGLNPKKWGWCAECDGNGIDKTVEKQYNRWRSKEPPKGSGYQMWNTTTEGHPETPVFKTLEELCRYCTDNCTVFGYDKGSYEKWMSILGDGDIVMKQEGHNIFI